MWCKRLAPYLVIVLVGVLVYLDIFLSPGFLVKSDNPVHMVEAKYLADVLIPKYHWINGWYPFELAGNPTQMYSYQLGIWLVALVYNFGVPLFLAYKLGFLLAVLSIPWTLFFALRKRVPGEIALACAASFLLLADVAKLFLAGMWAYAIGVALLIVLMDHLASGGLKLNKNTFVKAGVLLGLIILAHPFVTVAGFYTLGIAWLLSLAKKGKDKIKGMFWYGAAALLGVLLSLFYLYPYVETFGWFGTEYGWGLGSSVGEMVYKLIGIFFSLKPFLLVVDVLESNALGEIMKTLVITMVKTLPGMMIGALAVVGAFLYKKRGRSDDFLNLVAGFVVVSLVIGTGFWFLFDWGRNVPFFGAVLSYRFVYMAKVGLVVFAGIGLSEMKWKFKKVGIAIVCGIIVLGALLGAYNPPESYTATSDKTPIFEETLRMWGWIKENVPKETRILNQNFFGNIKEPLVTFDSILPAMANYYTGHEYVGSWYTTVFPLEDELKTEEFFLFGKKIEDNAVEEVVEKMKVFNIGYVIAVEGKLKKLLTDSEYFEAVYTSENYKIFKVKESVPSLVEGHGVEVVSYGEQRVRLKVLENHARIVTVKIAYHPYWKALRDSEELQLVEDENKLMSVVLPEGAYDMDVVYKPRNWVFIGASVLVWLSVLFFVVRKTYKR